MLQWCYGAGLRSGGGAERRLLAHLGTFVQGTSVCEVYWASNASLVDELVKGRIVDEQDIRSRFIPLDDCALGGTVNPAAFFKMMDRFQIDVLHFPLIQGSLIPLYMALYAKRRYRVVATVAYADYAAREWTRLHTRIAGSLLLRRAQLIDSLYPVFKKTYPNLSPKTRITPCSFTDYSLFTPHYPKAKEVVFCGRLIASKRPDLFVDAVHELQLNADPSVLQGWRFRIVGGGEMRGSLLDRIQRYGLTSVLSVEQTPTTFSILNGSSIFVSLGLYENYPSQSLLEAIAAGNAVLATDVGETRRLLDESFACLVPANVTADQLARELLLLMKDEDRRLDMGRRGREAVMQKHGSRFCRIPK